MWADGMVQAAAMLEEAWQAVTTPAAAWERSSLFAPLLSGGVNSHGLGLSLRCAAHQHMPWLWACLRLCC